MSDYSCLSTSLYCIWKSDAMNKEDKRHWVPDNLSYLRKVLGKVPCTYGLPLFQLYYSSPCIDHDGVSNRLNGANDKLHAFRIIVGYAWNWFVSRIAGYELTTADLDRTIETVLKQAANSKFSNDERDWNDWLCIDKDDKDFRFVMLLFNEIQDLKTPADGWEFIEYRIGRYAIQNEALTTFVPIRVQHDFKIRFGKDAIKEFKEAFHCRFNARFDITKDICAWACNYDEGTIRACSWLSGKQIQRLLKKAGIHNSKAKHRRKENKDGKDHHD